MSNTFRNNFFSEKAPLKKSNALLHFCQLLFFQGVSCWRRLLLHREGPRPDLRVRQPLRAVRSGLPEEALAGLSRDGSEERRGERKTGS